MFGPRRPRTTLKALLDVVSNMFKKGQPLHLYTSRAKLQKTTCTGRGIGLGI